ncbi:hypothetical protein [Methanococcoides sp. FTZ1]|uniref:hypothetical protein n=1 Tax=Methanococcoides sp. FTZ1 TaxID=3439061 RepID=UPI003F84F943
MPTLTVPQTQQLEIPDDLYEAAEEYWAEFGEMLEHTESPGLQRMARNVKRILEAR